jgi:hypothetical protein
MARKNSRHYFLEGCATATHVISSFSFVWSQESVGRGRCAVEKKHTYLRALVVLMAGAGLQVCMFFVRLMCVLLQVEEHFLQVLTFFWQVLTFFLQVRGFFCQVREVKRQVETSVCQVGIV